MIRRGDFADALESMALDREDDTKYITKTWRCPACKRVLGHQTFAHPAEQDYKLDRVAAWATVSIVLEAIAHQINCPKRYLDQKPKILVKFG